MSPGKDGGEFGVREIAHALAALFVLGNSLWYWVEHAALASQTLAFPHALDYVEGPVLAQVFRLLRGAPLYPPDYGSAPFFANGDPPLFAWLQSQFFKGAGPAYWYGRALSLGSALMACLCVVLIVHALTGNWIGGIGGGMLMFAFPYVSQWSLFNSPETLALALALATTLALIKIRSRGGVIVGIVLLTATGLTRPGYVITPLVTGAVWLYGSGCKRDVALWVAGGLAALAALTLALETVTDGAFARNLLALNLRDFAMPQLTGLMLNVLVHGSFAVIGVALFFIVERLGDHEFSATVALANLLSAFATSFSAGIAGADMSVMLELIAALSISAGVALAWAGRNRWMATAALVALYLQLSSLQEWTQSAHTPLIRRVLGARAERFKLMQTMRDAGGPVLTDEFIGWQLMQGQEPYILPAEFAALQRNGLWDDKPMIEALQKKRFNLVVLFEPQGAEGGEARIFYRWPESVRKAIYANYAEAGIEADSILYRPR